MAFNPPAHLAMLWLNEPRRWALGTQSLHMLWPSTIPVPWSSGHPRGHSIYSRHCKTPCTLVSRGLKI